MEVNEFVKKYGLNSFKAAMACPQFARYKYTIIYSDEIDFSNELIEKRADYMFNTSEVKRLIESHDLVESCGGLDLARKEAHKNCFDFNAPLLKAILDVESCQ